MSFAEEHALLLQERASQLYSTSSYFVAKLLIDVPVVALVSLAFSVLVFFALGLGGGGGAAAAATAAGHSAASAALENIPPFFKFWIIILAVNFVGHGVGLFVAAAVPASIVALVAPIFISPFILFSHYALPGDPEQSISPVLRPLQVLSPFWWGFDALCALEFSGLKLMCTAAEQFVVPTMNFGNVRTRSGGSRLCCCACIYVKWCVCVYVYVGWYVCVCAYLCVFACVVSCVPGLSFVIYEHSLAHAMHARARVSVCLQVTSVCRFILGEEVLASYSIPAYSGGPRAQEQAFVEPVRNLFLIAVGYVALAGIVLKVAVDRAVKGAPLLPPARAPLLPPPPPLPQGRPAAA